MYKTGTKYDAMLGIGYGTEEHDEKLPADTLALLAHANGIRGNLNCNKAALVLADIGVEKERAARRRILISWLLNTLEASEHWDLVYQTEMPRETVGDVRISDKVKPENKRYFGDEVKDARLILNEGGWKIGWLFEKTQESEIGGEKDFDTEIAENFPGIYNFAYADVVGVPLSREHGHRKNPYLVKTKELADRLCIADLSEMEIEIRKIESKIGNRKNKKNEAAREAALRFAGIILNRGTDTLAGEDLSQVTREAFLRLNSIKKEA